MEKISAKAMTDAREQAYSILVDTLGATRICAGVVLRIGEFDVVITPVVKKERLDLDYEIDEYRAKIEAAEQKEQERLEKLNEKARKQAEKDAKKAEKTKAGPPIPQE